MKHNLFIQSLLPNFDKERINEDIRITSLEMKNITIPAYKQAEPFLSKWTFQNPTVLKRIEIFNSIVERRRKNIITTIYEGLVIANVTLAELERLVDSSFESNVAGGGITYGRSTLLQMIEAIQFVSRYSRRLLNYIFVAETSQFENEDTVTEALTPADIQWVEDNFINFCNAFNVITKPTKELDKMIEAIPNVVISDDNYDNLVSVAGEQKVDPMKLGFIPVFLNPIYHISMRVAEWQTNRYHAAKQEVKCLQLRQIYLKSLDEKNSDAKIQKEIQYIEDRIQGYLRKNAEMEKRYG